MTTNDVREKAGNLAREARGWQFWLDALVNSLIGGFASSGITFLNNVSAAGLGVDMGDAISWLAFFYASGIGALIGGLKVLNKYANRKGGI